MYYTPYPARLPNTCPNCGHCPNCGRQSLPYHPGGMAPYPSHWYRPELGPYYYGGTNIPAQTTWTIDKF